MPELSLIAPRIGDRRGKPLAERLGHRRVAPDRQQRARQPRKQRAEMHVARQHDGIGAHPRRRRDDALAHARRIDADHRRLFEDAHARLLGQQGKAARIVQRVQMEGFRIMHRVEIAVRLQRLAHALDLPALDVGAETLRRAVAGGRPAGRRCRCWRLPARRRSAPCPASPTPGARTWSAPSCVSAHNSRAWSRPTRAIRSVTSPPKPGVTVPML